MPKMTAVERKKWIIDVLFIELGNNLYPSAHLFWERARTGMMKMSMDQLEALSILIRNDRKHMTEEQFRGREEAKNGKTEDSI